MNAFAVSFLIVALLCVVVPVVASAAIWGTLRIAARFNSNGTQEAGK